MCLTEGMLSKSATCGACHFLDPDQGSLQEGGDRSESSDSSDNSNSSESIDSSASDSIESNDNLPGIPKRRWWE